MVRSLHAGYNMTEPSTNPLSGGDVWASGTIGAARASLPPPRGLVQNISVARLRRALVVVYGRLSQTGQRNSPVAGRERVFWHADRFVAFLPLAESVENAVSPYTEGAPRRWCVNHFTVAQTSPGCSTRLGWTYGFRLGRSFVRYPGANH